MADDSDKLWPGIERSPFRTVYIGDLYWFAKQVEEGIAQIFEETPPPREGDDFIRVDHVLHGRILTVLLAAARIRALVRARESSGSQDHRAVLAGRTAALRQLIDGIDLTPVLDAGARNSIEHFDEYADEVAIKSYRGAIPRPTSFAVDMVLSTRRVLEQFLVGGERPTTYLLRAYVADERVFSNCGRELELEPLRECCSAIRARVEPLLPDFARNERGAAVLIVSAASFEGGAA